MKRTTGISLLLCAALLSGCGGNPTPQTSAAAVTAAEPAPTKPTEDTKMNIIIGGKTFTAVLENNESARAFAERLPLSVDMTELNGNEKYYRLPQRLPANDSRPKEIRTGDLMLYSGDCVVLFYKDFSTQYSYTRLGRVENPSGLAEALGTENIHVTFTKQKG